MKLRKFSLAIVALFLFSCQCQNIECESGPATVNLVFVDSLGRDQIGSGLLSLDQLRIVKLSDGATSFMTQNSSIISCTIADKSDIYEIVVKNKPIDTLSVFVTERKSDCCTNTVITDVQRKGQTIMFRPAVTINI